ncbi:outer membrane lipoprotein-sorting protein [Luteolibacter marinus]|uniref:outer membrane lipoprotein-sorting protein n=1 Tax=Luteolibacter marinus TaxID=2776705 RepID=UPI001867B6A0|nr:outer membrane lipoprotein-sorting protein [Luteolibacter marinus]
MKFLLAAASLFATVAPLHAQNPDPDAMIRSIRLSATLQQMDLKGEVEKFNGKKSGIMLFVRENNMQFRLDDTGERFHIRMGDENAELRTLDDKGNTSVFPTSKLVRPIAGSDITYEDLTLRFLYWKNAELKGEERVNGADCYKIRLNNPGRGGAYGAVFVWVHKKYGAFWQVRAHDRKGKAIKEFQVDSVMKLPDDKGYTIKKMQVSTLDGDKRQSITYLTFEKPASGPKGPRR